MSDGPLWLASVAARWLHFASLYLLFGGGAFALAAGRKATLPRTRRGTAAILRLAAVVADLSGTAWLAASLAGMAGGIGSALDPGFLRLFFFDTPFGPVEIVRLGLFVALLAAAALPDRLFLVAATAVAGALLVDQAWLGHAAEGGARGHAMIAAYAIHVLAGAIWLGGLMPLLLALAEERAGGAAALLRFSNVAAAAALAVVGSGIANTAFHAGGDVAALTASDYGRVLAIKLVFVAAMLLLAALTRFRLMPRLRRGEPARLSRAIALEAGAGVAVLLAAAVLGITAPPR